MSFVRGTELDPTSFPEFRDRILARETDPIPHEPRSYPGYPRHALERARRRLLVGLDRALERRRSARALGTELPPRAALSRILASSHGVQASEGRGPVPSAGGLQALELFVVALESGWLPAGAYHYDRAGHFLSQVVAGASREEWLGRVPSLEQVAGGSLLWVLVGDGSRVREKYGERGERFLLLEAGHLMQNLCVTSASVGCATVPLGGAFEREIAAALVLPGTDLVLYLGVAGAIGVAGVAGAVRGASLRT